MSKFNEHLAKLTDEELRTAYFEVNPSSFVPPNGIVRRIQDAFPELAIITFIEKEIYKEIARRSVLRGFGSKLQEGGE